MPKQIFLGDLLRPGSGMGFGRVPADVMIIGDNPPKKALVNGGQQFTKSVQGLWRDLQDTVGDISLYFTFLVKEALLDGKKQSPIREARKGWAVLVEEIKLVKPKRILVYGYHATRFLAPGFKSLREDHGSIFFNEDLQVEVVPTFDPLVGFYDPERGEYFMRDLVRLFTVNRPEPYPTVVYQTGETVNWDLGDVAVVDVETTGLTPRTDRVTMLGVFSPGKPVVVLQNPSMGQMQSLHRAIRDRGTSVLGHNVKFDLLFLSYGSREPWTDFPVFDTMLQARVAGERVLSLKHLTTMLTERPGPHSMGGIQDVAYLREDLLSTWEVFVALSRKTPTDTPAVDLLNHATRAFVDMYLAGVRVDRSVLDETIETLAVKSHEALTNLEKLGSINWNSSEQVSQWLLDNGVKLTEKTETGQWSTGAEVLRELVDDYPQVGDLLAYREAEKLANYVREYRTTVTEDHPFVHSEYNLTGARSGRISSENPNLQNVPAELKKLFVSRWVETGGLVGVVDLSQAELRVAGILSGDRGFADMLNSEDVHRATASIVFEVPLEKVDGDLRRAAKGVNFGLVYGGSAFGLAKKMGTTEAHVQEILDRYESKFPGLMGFLGNLGRYAVKHKKITSPTGRTRDLLAEFQNKGAGAVRRIGQNTPIQTTSSDVTLFILVSSWYELKRRGLRSKVIGTVHDSIVYDVAPGESQAVAECVQAGFQALQNWVLAYKFPMFWEVPFTGEFGVGRSWYEAEKEPTQTWDCSSLAGREVTQ